MSPTACADRSVPDFASEAMNLPRKEVITMTYDKPELWILGNAASVITSNKPLNIGVDGHEAYTPTPAYELDE